jgi:hypothetical protein
VADRRAVRDGIDLGPVGRRGRLAPVRIRGRRAGEGGVGVVEHGPHTLVADQGVDLGAVAHRFGAAAEEPHGSGRRRDVVGQSQLRGRGRRPCSVEGVRDGVGRRKRVDRRGDKGQVDQIEGGGKQGGTGCRDDA